MFHHTLYPKPKIDLEDAEISNKIQQKLQILKQDHDDIISKYSSDIGLTNLAEMKIRTSLKLPPVGGKPYPLPLKHHKIVTEEIERLLEAGLIECLLSFYAIPVIVIQKTR